jgi:uncharacterized protein (TIGR02217 family)
MSNLVFPDLPGLTYPVKKSPTWKTDISETVSGLETRISYWSYPVWRYGISFSVLRDDAMNELWTLIGFFNRHFGSWDSWLFRDPDDYMVVGEVMGVGTGTQTAYQLIRSKGGYTEPVYSPSTNVAIKVNNVAVTQGVHYSLSPTGHVNFFSPPADNVLITWSGEFYWRCRFEDDSVDFEKFANRIWESQEVKFRSIKL